MQYVGGKEMKERALHRFDEVFDLQMGKTPDRKTPQYFGGDNVWVSIRDMNKKEIFDSNEHITDAAVKATNIRKVKKGTVIMSFKLTVGKCAIAARDLYTNEAIMAFNLKDGFDISPDFLYYYLQGYKWEGANKAVMGMTLNKATISQHKIAFPTLFEQQSIVAELDKINELITLKKTQLNDLDSLSQSIFYDMFGDPITNEKGWDVKKLEEICLKITDGTHNSPINTETGDYMYVTAKNIKQDGITTDNITYVSKDIHKSIYERCNPEYGDILYIKDGVTTGIATINTIEKEFSLLSSVALLKPGDTVINYYLKAVLNMPSQYESIRKNMGGAAITRLTISKINSIKVPLPPVALQRTFANRVSIIEHIRQNISSTIKDLETLLASRMQYWFD